MHASPRWHRCRRCRARERFGPASRSLSELWVSFQQIVTRRTTPGIHLRSARSLKGNSSIAPGCRASGYPGCPSTRNPEACRASLQLPTPHALRRQHRMCNRITPSTRWSETDAMSGRVGAGEGLAPTQILTTFVRQSCNSCRWIHTVISTTDSKGDLAGAS